MTVVANTDHRRWSFENADFQGFFTLDHLYHLLIKTNRNTDTSQNAQNSFVTNAGLGGPRGPQRMGNRSS